MSYVLKNMLKEFQTTPLALTLQLLSIVVAGMLAYGIFALERPLTIAGLPIQVSVDPDDPMINTWAVCDDNNYFVYGIDVPVRVKNYGVRSVELSRIETSFSGEQWNSELMIDDRVMPLSIPLNSSEDPINWHIRASRTHVNPTTEIINNVNKRQGEQVLITLYFNDEPRDLSVRFIEDFTSIYESDCVTS